MPIENHPFVKECPELQQRIRELLPNRQFQRIFYEYDAVTRIAHRIETGVESAADEFLDILKKQRVKLKDKLFTLLRKAA